MVVQHKIVDYDPQPTDVVNGGIELPEIANVAQRAKRKSESYGAIVRKCALTPNFG